MLQVVNSWRLWKIVEDYLGSCRCMKVWICKGAGGVVEIVGIVECHANLRKCVKSMEHCRTLLSIVEIYEGC